MRSRTIRPLVAATIASAAMTGLLSLTGFAVSVAACLAVAAFALAAAVIEIAFAGGRGEWP